MNKSEIYTHGFINGAAALSFVGLLFTLIINETGQRLGAGYIIFGLPIITKLGFWFYDMIKEKQ